MRRSLLIALILCVAITARAEKELVDRVVAIVDEAAVFQSEVDQMVKQLLLQQGVTDVPPGQRQLLEQRALQELVNSKLILAKAERVGVQASFSEIEDMVEKAIEDNKKTLGGSAAFERQLAAEGMTIEELKRLYREQIRNRILVDRVLATEIDRGSLQITDEEVRAAYEARKDNMQLRPAVVHLATIFMPFESSENARKQALAEIEDLYRRIAGGEDFAELAREKSEDPSAENGGYLGWLNLDDLADQAIAEAARGLAVGEVSEPVLTSYGYHLIQVTGKDPDDGRVELRHILVRIEAGSDDIQEVYQQANNVLDKLLAGAPFDSMAIEYSQDKATAPSGGDLGWLRVDDLPQFFRDVLKDMDVGDISHVLREPSGFRIVKLIGSEEARPYTYAEVQEELRKMLQQEKLAGSYDDYVKGLRDEFYVAIIDE